MKVYIKTSNVTGDRAIARIAQAFRQYSQNPIEIVASQEDADLVVFFIVGRKNHNQKEADRLLNQKKKYVVIQLCLRSTMNPQTADWLPLWKNAELVWSYYDLPALCREDAISADFNFYYAPVGIDKVFKETPTEKIYAIASSGRGYLTESARECILAANAVGKRAFHIGEAITDRPNVDFSKGMSDKQLAKKYSACEFVSGLRRKEGFELPVIEGLMCGARPIVFDKPHYRTWFYDLAEFIPERSRENIIEDLTELFKKGARPVSQKEKQIALERFNWKTIIKGFWKIII